MIHTKVFSISNEYMKFEYNLLLPNNTGISQEKEILNIQILQY